MRIFRHTLTWHWLLFALPLMLLLRPYLHEGVPFTHDGENHLARFANYKIALREGQLPPRFAPNLMNHYGYPVFNYNYPLANIASLPLSAMGVSYEVTFKVLSAVGLFVGVWGVLAWLKACGFGRFERFFAAGTLLLTPATINLIFVRGSIGEVWALGLFPWLLWLTKRIKKHEPVSLLLSVALITAFLLSHNISVLFGGLLWLVYSVAKFRRQPTYWRALLLPALLAGFMSAWFWLPALLEKNLVVLDGAQLSSQFSRHFVEPHQLVTAPLQFGYSFDVPVDTMSFSIGFVAVAALLIVSLWLVKRKPMAEKRRTAWLWFFAVVCWLLLFLQTATSGWVWKLLPLVAFIQFPWRLSLFVSIFVLLLVATALQLGPWVRRLVWLCALIQVGALWRLQPVGFVHKPDLEWDLFAQSTSTLNENRVKGFTYLLIGDWQPAPTALTGEIQAVVHRWTGSARSYSVNVVSEAVIVEPTMLFAGWRTTANGQPVTYLDSSETEGRLGYRLPPGEYEIVSRFTQLTWPRITGNTLSALALIVWGWLVWQQNKQSFGK